MDKRSLSERDICTKFITPALRKAGWDEMSQIREEVSFTKGRIIVRGKLVARGRGKRADDIPEPADRSHDPKTSLWRDLPPPGEDDFRRISTCVPRREAFNNLLESASVRRGHRSSAGGQSSCSDPL